MKNCDKNTTSSYRMYLDAKSLYGQAMYQKLSVYGFEQVKKLSKCNSIEFDERFIKFFDKNSNTGYFLEVDVEYPKKLFNLHKKFQFLPERKKIKKRNKLVCNIHDKENYVAHIRALKQAIKSWINTKKSTQSNSI